MWCKVKTSSIEDIKFWLGRERFRKFPFPPHLKAQVRILLFFDRKVNGIDKTCYNRGIFMREKEFYRKQIIEMVQKIKRYDILIYIYKLVVDIVKEDVNEN